MLERHNKLVMLIVLATFMFSMVVSASAATFSDVSGSDAQSSAVYKLNSLGIIDGYPDGTFGPDKTITRAEFAKIAVYTAGLQGVASGMGNTASAFSDVTTDNWANGWINVAAAQGFVKGDPNGTFRPSDEITQAEVITVLMRILGYNDNLPGDWPSDYIAKAANLGVLDDLTFVSSKAATRGETATLGNAVLEEDMVDYRASDNIFTSSDETLLAAKFKNANTIKDAAVYDVDLSGGEVALSVGWYQKDSEGDKVWTTGKYTIAKDCVLTNSYAWSMFTPGMIDFVLNDDDEITYVKVLDYGVLFVTPDDLKITAMTTGADGSAQATKISLNDKSYDCDPNWFSINPYYWYLKYGSGDPSYFSGKVTANQTLEESLAADGFAEDMLQVILNKDGDIQVIKSDSWLTGKTPGVDAMGIVEKVSQDNKKITFKNGGSIQLDKDDAENYCVMYDGMPATLENIQPNDLVWCYPNAHNVDELVYVFSAKNFSISGKMDSYEDGENLPVSSGALKRVTIDGKTYDVAIGGSFLYSDDKGESFDLRGVGDADVLDEVVGEDVTIWITPVANKVFAISGAATGTSGKVYGVINDDTVNTLVNGKLTNAIEVLKSDGTLATYAPGTDSEIYTTSWIKMSTDATDFIGAAKVLKDGTLVEISLNSDGYIDRINTADNFGTSYANITGDKDNDVVTFDAKDYDASGMVVFNLTRNSDGDYQVASTSDFLDKIDGITPKAATGYFYEKDDTMKYAVISDASLTTSSNKIAMVYSKGKDSTDPYVNLMTTGDSVKYYVKDTATDWKDNTVNVYTVSGRDVKLATDVTTADYLTNGVTGQEISNISGKIITVGAKSFFVDSDTLYFDNTGDNPAVAALSDLASGDKVNIYYDGTGAVAAIEIVN